jgi:hypothetical protein
MPYHQVKHEAHSPVPFQETTNATMLLQQLHNGHAGDPLSLVKKFYLYQCMTVLCGLHSTAVFSIITEFSPKMEPHTEFIYDIHSKTDLPPLHANTNTNNVKHHTESGHNQIKNI